MKYASWIKELGEGFLGEILKTGNYTDVISFAGGLPASELFPKEELKDCFNRVFDLEAQTALQYAETRGYFPLREWIAQQFFKNNSYRDIDEVLITSGSQQGLSLVAQTFLDPGDMVLVESPTYLGALQAFQGCRPSITMVSSDKEGIMPDELEKILINHKPKFLYLIPNYQNPTGRQMSLERRLQLVDIAKKYDLLILEDNAYGELRYEGEVLPNLIEMYENVIYLGSFSKVLTPGLRVGFVIADIEIVNFLERAKEGMDLFSNNLSQHAVYRYITGGKFADHILKLRQSYKIRRDTMIEAFSQYAGNAMQIDIPKGGLFIWAKINTMQDSTEFLKRAVEEKVIFVPGTFFYSDARISNEMRINFSCSTPETITEGVKRLARTIEKL